MPRVVLFLVGSALLAAPASAGDAGWLALAEPDHHVTEWPELTAGARAEAARLLASGPGAQTGADAEAAAALQRALEAGFARDVLDADLEARLRADAAAPDADLRVLDAFAASPAARAIVAARERAARPAGLHAFPVFASDLQARRIPDAALDAARAIDRATRLSAHAAALAARVGRAALRGALALRCRPGGRDAPEEARERERLARLLGPFQERVWAWILFRHREVPEPDLARYVALLGESPAARAFHDAFDRHHRAALDAGMQRFHIALLPAVEARCAGP